MKTSQRRFDCTIAGEINLDVILYGLPETLPLEREILASDFQMTLGSSSAIVAHNLATLGKRVGFATLVGPDEMGRIALDRLSEGGVDVSQIRRDATTPTGATILLHHGKRRRILTYPGTMSIMTRADLDLEYLRSSRHFHLSSLFLQRALAPNLPALFRDLKREGLTISLDTNDDPDDVWDGVLDSILEFVDVLLPNEAEACRIARKGTVEEALEALSTRVPCIAAKCGPQGAWLQTGGKLVHVPGIAVEPVDTIGAGDSFDAGYLYGHLSGLDPVACAEAGNIAGALSTLRPGGTEAFRDRELREVFLRQHRFPFATA